jgi:hypothetical protein
MNTFGADEMNDEITGLTGESVSKVYYCMYGEPNMH